MLPRLIRLFMAGIALTMIAAFTFMYMRAIYLVWSSSEKVVFTPAYVYVATILAGLVGGVAAMIFNEELPDDPAAVPRPGPPGVAVATPSDTGPTAAATALVRAVTPQDGHNRLFSYVSAAYVIVYFLTGCAAIATWVKADENTPDLIRNLAFISIGLFVAIARTFFRVPKP